MQTASLETVTLLPRPQRGKCVNNVSGNARVCRAHLIHETNNGRVGKTVPVRDVQSSQWVVPEPELAILVRTRRIDRYSTAHHGMQVMKLS
jgi:hypothetical protein